LAMTVAFAMVACSNGSTSTTEDDSQWTISFDSNDWEGTGVPRDPVKVNKGSAYTLPVLPTTWGRQLFTGWATSADGQTISGPTYTPTGNVTLFVRWESYNPNTDVIVKFYADTTAEPATLADFRAILAAPYVTTRVTKTQPIGAANFPPDPVKAGFTFLGWAAVSAAGVDSATTLSVIGDLPYDDNFTDGSAVTESLYVFAQWEIVPPLTITFFDYQGGTQLTVMHLEEGQSIGDAGEKLPATPTRAGYTFNQWVDSYGTPVTADTSFLMDTTVVGAWWSNTLTDTGDALEKVVLENGSFVIYEFDVTGKDLNTITGVSVDYKVSEAMANKGVRNLRLMGPYIHEDYITNIDVEGGAPNPDPIPHYGDFAYDANGAPTARFISGATANDNYRNKNAPYINLTVNSDWAANAQAAFGEAATVVADTWFTVTYPFNYELFADTTLADTAPGGNGNTVHQVNKLGNNRVATNATNKIYFGIGLTSQGVNDGGIEQLVKNVTLNTSGGAVNGTIPDFDNDGVGDQAFASYFDPIQYNWRGASNATYARPTKAAVADPRATVDLDVKDEIGDFDDESGAGYFYVNLSDWETVTPASANINATKVTGSFDGIATQGPLTVNFTENSQRVNIGLLPKYITQLQEASGSIKITIDGETTATHNFRYHLGNPLSGANWNGTSGSGDHTFAELVAGKHDVADDPATPDKDETATDVANNVQTFSANMSALTLGYFILQNRADTAATVKINSIRVDYFITPADAPPQAAEDFVVYKSTTVGGSDAPLVSDAMTGNWQTLTNLNGAGPIVFPEQDGEQLTIRSYKRFDIKVKYFDASGNEVTPNQAAGSGIAQCSFTPTGGSGAIDHYNLGQDTPANADGTVNAPTSRTKYNAIKDAVSLDLNFQFRNNADYNGYTVELLEIVFYKDL